MTAYRAIYHIINGVGDPLTLTQDVVGRWKLDVYGHKTDVDADRANEIIINAHSRGYVVEVTSWIGPGARPETSARAKELMEERKWLTPGQANLIADMERLDKEERGT